MKAGRFYEAAATVWLTASVLNGVIAHHYDEEASRAKGIEQIYTAQGNQQQAAEWSVYSSGERHERNINLELIALDLGLAALSGVIAVSHRREQEPTPQPTQPAPEA